METDQIAYCGLYCANCFKFKKGTCQGCKVTESNSWCKIRSCAKQKGYLSCADCSEPGHVKCKTYNNFIGKVFGLVFNSDRAACIQLIKDEGYPNFAQYMAANNLQTIPRRRK
ncbi:MAG TPA: hypothetical protein DCQ26_12205 [Marinilabiliales bacterium]|jgi:hypothetical protein|nr:DUF3795 domain-containing protein [Salinivirgaceae bacterium]OFX38451.1 MAG: hypothetical protein A2W95_19195 [Bacteroidetes bacterium GWA2_40_14]OFX60335.1 MAG: hypothetical protein A2W84_08030 [Bacteroidetes bacterium GWC2_40_13]OFX76083.1 MAG: hypothetical protein A2W96_01385 [Bacteroidetes bacterium GWD2_40_43]OFX94303.1 MAG: hypothetical protein A2W97_19235 [Bacteroidetes bacterium GWE2_40_63]OFY18782.1 MAG: hypothetical protein A2W88_06000 [Bacteroidetes bacterium GWF2_40_13]OFZ24756